MNSLLGTLPNSAFLPVAGGTRLGTVISFIIKSSLNISSLRDRTYNTLRTILFFRLSLLDMTTVRSVSGTVSTFRLFSQRPRVPFVSLFPFSWLVGFHRHRRMSSQPPLEPRVFPSSGFDLIDPSILVEEESIPNYKPQRFYTVRIGQIFNQRYQAVGKLGYGASSTVWLCRDLEYVTILYMYGPRES